MKGPDTFHISLAHKMNIRISCTYTNSDVHVIVAIHKLSHPIVIFVGSLSFFLSIIPGKTYNHSLRIIYSRKELTRLKFALKLIYYLAAYSFIFFGGNCIFLTKRLKNKSQNPVFSRDLVYYRKPVQILIDFLICQLIPVKPCGK